MPRLGVVEGGDMRRTIVTPIARVKRTRIGVLLSSVLVLAFTQGLFAHTNAADVLNPRLREYLEGEIGFTVADLESVIADRPVVKLLKTKTKDEIAILGVVRIRAPQELFIEKLRDIASFENGRGVRGIGRFSSPALVSDVSTLVIDSGELKALPNCRPGNCPIKLSDRAMKTFREQIDWSSPKSSTQAHSVIRKLFTEYITNYQKLGDDALAVYSDKEEPEPIRDHLRQLLNSSKAFINYDSELADYLVKYPQDRPPNTEDIFYWQKGEFGLKPVVRASHVVIHRNPENNDSTYVIASKMLFASHYFRAALELKSVVPDSASAGTKSFYLVCLNRAFVDGLTGLKGRFIRGTVLQRSKKSLGVYLAVVKQKIESAYQQD